MSELDDFKAVLADYPEGLPAGFRVVLNIGSSSTTPPPPDTTPPPSVSTERTVSLVLETDSNPTVTATWDIPDVNSINKYLLFNRQSVTESVPSAVNRTMPKEPDLIAREAHLRNTLKDWAWLPRQAVKNAGGKIFSYPDANGVGGRNLSDPAKFEGMWIKRESLSTPTPPEWIEALVAKVKRQW